MPINPPSPASPMRPTGSQAAVKALTEANLETGIDNFLRLMRRELADPLIRVAELAERMEVLRASGFLPATLAGEQVFSELADTARRSATMADRLIRLGNILTGPSLAADERILIIDSLRNAAVNMSEMARRRRVGIQFDDGLQNLAPIYGSTYWLGVAMQQLIALLVDDAPPGTHVLVRTRQMGFHQLVSGSVNHGRPARQSIDLLPQSRTSVKAVLASATHTNHIDLALARAIIELHGGKLKTDITQAGVLNEFQLTLPTGESQANRERPECGACHHVRQAEQFAQDIGELLNALNSTQSSTHQRS